VLKDTLTYMRIKAGYRILRGFNMRYDGDRRGSYKNGEAYAPIRYHTIDSCKCYNCKNGYPHEFKRPPEKMKFKYWKNYDITKKL
jgi:hypothetical protein